MGLGSGGQAHKSSIDAVSWYIIQSSESATASAIDTEWLCITGDERLAFSLMLFAGGHNQQQTMAERAILAD